MRDISDDLSGSTLGCLCTTSFCNSHFPNSIQVFANTNTNLPLNTLARPDFAMQIHLHFHPQETVSKAKESELTKTESEVQQKSLETLVQSQKLTSQKEKSKVGQEENVNTC